MPSDAKYKPETHWSVRSSLIQMPQRCVSENMLPAASVAGVHPGVLKLVCL